MLPTPITKAATYALMAQADLIVATGSQANIRAAYSSGTPALGVGAGNVAVIVDETAACVPSAQMIAKSKTFDNATSCSSENALVLVGAARAEMRAALRAVGGHVLNALEKKQLEKKLWPDGVHLSATLIAQSAIEIARSAAIEVPQDTRFLIVEESGVGPDFLFSGEKLSPVLTLYDAPDFEAACARVGEIYAHQGAGHSVGYHGMNDDHVAALARTLPVARVIVNQAHAIATGGSFDNGLPFSLSMGCGSWGGNSFSENLHWRHFMNVTRVVRPIAPREPSVNEIFAPYWKAVGQ